jgi:hypothetical protein
MFAFHTAESSQEETYLSFKKAALSDREINMFEGYNLLIVFQPIAA